jgi:hypothetical protein
MYHAVRGSILVLVTGLSIAVLPAGAQQADTGVAIATISAGGLFGLGGHGSYGASLADGVTKYLVPFVDFSYSPLSSYAFTYGTNLTGKGLYTSSLLDANGGIKVRFPNKSFWVPYLGLGGGVLRLSSSTNTSGFGTTAAVNTSKNELAANVSAGALYYVTQHIGMQIEAKGYLAHQNQVGRVSAGLFFQFR